MDQRVMVKCVGGADCRLGWSGSGEGVMATFNPLVTVGHEFQLLLGWRNYSTMHSIWQTEVGDM